MGANSHLTGDKMEEKAADLPVRPITNEQRYLDVICRELRAIHELLAPAVAEEEDDLFTDEVQLKESSSSYPSPQPSPARGEGD